MCGRIASAYAWKDIEEEFDVDKVFAEFTPRFNVAPSQQIPVIVAGSVAFDNYKWGLIPHWSKDTKTAMINARAETLKEKPWFKEAFTNFRCLIPVSGFFEWDKSKAPHYISLKGKKVFALAGIASIYKPKDGKTQSISTCCIITIDANSFVSKIHHRMPAIIEKKNYAEWLNPQNKDLDSLQEMLLEFPAKAIMSEYQISTLVNSPKNDSPEILKKVEMQAKL